MTMSFFLHDRLDSADSFEPREVSPNTPRPTADSTKNEQYIFWEKLKVPPIDATVVRPRLSELLDKSLAQFGATLISGRAGTGKTALAAAFANTRKHAAWYSVESSDQDWTTFSRHFRASVLKSIRPKADVEKSRKTEKPSLPTISRFLAALFSEVEDLHSGRPLLIVLDDLHRIFDAEWFGDFFNLLLFSFPAGTHLLLLCRSRPPGPLWRLRSKQMLNVIDEKLMAFNIKEAEEFFRQNGLPKKAAKTAHAESFGRISKLIEIADKAKRRSTSD